LFEIVGEAPVPPKSPDHEVAVVKSSVSSVSRLVGVLVIFSQSCLCSSSPTEVRKPGSFVKSFRVTAVKFSSESPIASASISTASIVSAAMSALAIVSSVISLVSIAVPSVEAITLLASIVMPVP